MIEEEKEKLNQNGGKKLLIGGFSQGAMVSLSAFINYKGPNLGGVIGLSGA